MEAAVPLHSCKPLRRTWLNRSFAAVYGSAVLALLRHRFLNVLESPTLTSLAIFLADAVLAFMWFTYQGFRMRPVRRQTFPENLSGVAKSTDLPAVDVFICTADPYKEPPMSVVNTALSVMAYDYPKEKLSVYVSDDGGSQLTLFAFMEAAKFAAHWLPYCEKKKIVKRCPEAYFGSDPAWFPESDDIKNMYERMKMRVERAVGRGGVPPDYMSTEDEAQAFSKWTDGFTRQDHPSLIQVLLESSKDTDIEGHAMPNLIYVSREKNPSTPHNFKAGALNVLLRVSAAMTNAPIILTLDCDMYSNDPQTPARALCYLLDPQMESRLAFVQFPQLFHNIDKHDIYSTEFKYIFQIDTAGMDGLGGPIHVGTGCFFRRRALFGSPSLYVPPESPNLGPDHFVNKPIRSQEVLLLAHRVAGSEFEAQTKWGSKMGFRYGSLVEDFYTSFRLHCEGWRSVFCHPNRPAFFGYMPLTLDELLNQTKRWSLGLMEVAFCRQSPVTLGFQSLNPFHVLCYLHYSFWPIWAIPITIYAFLPQLALLNSHAIFPKVSDPWFLVYVFLFVGAYAQDLIDFVLEGGIVQRWWNSQRMWLVRGVSSFLLGLSECLLKFCGIVSFGFNVTSKVVDEQLVKRHEQGIMEFGVASPAFMPLTVSAIINLFSFVFGVIHVLRNGGLEQVFVQMFLSGFVVVNSWPLYEAMLLRRDKGKMPLKISLASAVAAWALYWVSYLAF